MTWQRYNLVFRLQSPLHIGWRKVGNLMQTRRYVPGKNLWAALTQRLTQKYITNPKFSDYQQMGEELKQHFRFGYLYPALENGQGYEIHHPWADPHFDYRFLDSYASTALAKRQRTAEPGALHEAEFIRPHARALAAELPQQVYLRGELYVQPAWAQDSVLAHWRDALRHIQIGGERSYGWGKLMWENPNEKPLPESEPPQIQLGSNQRLSAHLLAMTGEEAVDGVEGMVEPLVGWERGDPDVKAYWRLTPSPIVAYRPGSRVTRDLTLGITPFGLLEVMP